MIVTVGNTKGGVGKTMLAINFAVARAAAGIDVWLIDGDRQQTATTAIAMRSEAQRSPLISCAAYADGALLRSQILQQRSKFTEIVIDVGGRDSTALRAALMVTDILVIPFQPRSYDVWALADIAALVGEAKALRDGLKAYAVINCADPAGTDNRDAAAAVIQYPELEYVDAPIHRRKAYANAAGQGLGVQELSSVDVKANSEISKLLSLVYA